MDLRVIGLLRSQARQIPKPGYMQSELTCRLERKNYSMITHTSLTTQSQCRKELFSDCKR